MALLPSMGMEVCKGAKEHGPLSASYLGCGTPTFVSAKEDGNLSATDSGYGTPTFVSAVDVDHLSSASAYGDLLSSASKERRRTERRKTATKKRKEDAMGMEVCKGAKEDGNLSATASGCDTTTFVSAVDVDHLSSASAYGDQLSSASKERRRTERRKTATKKRKDGNLSATDFGCDTPKFVSTVDVDHLSIASAFVSLGNEELYPKNEHDEWLRQNGVAMLADGETDWCGRTNTIKYKQTSADVPANSAATVDNKWRWKGNSPHEDLISWEVRRSWHREHITYAMDPEPAADLDQVQLTSEYAHPAKLPTYRVDKDRKDTRSCADKTLPDSGTSRDRFVGKIKHVQEELEMMKENQETSKPPPISPRPVQQHTTTSGAGRSTLHMKSPPPGRFGGCGPTTAAVFAMFTELKW